MDLSTYTDDELLKAYASGEPMAKLYYEDCTIFVRRQELEEELKERKL